MKTSWRYSAPYQKVVETRRAAGLIDDADRHLHQFVQRQPEIFGMALLREEERQQKDRQEQEQDRDHEPRQPLKQRPHRPELKCPVQVFRIAEAKGPVIEEVGVARKAETGCIACEPPA